MIAIFTYGIINLFSITSLKSYWPVSSCLTPLLVKWSGQMAEQRHQRDLVRFGPKSVSVERKMTDLVEYE